MVRRRMFRDSAHQTALVDSQPERGSVRRESLGLDSPHKTNARGPPVAGKNQPQHLTARIGHERAVDPSIRALGENH